MNKLWIFGDSFSEPFSKVKALLWKTKYIQWKGYMPKCYGEVISDKLKLKHINLAIGGTDNYTILDTIINVLNSIEPDDIIIIGWSSTLRFRLVNKTNTFNTILPGARYTLDDFSSNVELSKSTLEELAVNRDNSIYIDELNNYIKLLNFAFPNNKIIHWSPFFRQEIGGILTTRSNINSNLNHLKNLERVTDETKGEINDYHYSENGHIILAEEFINIIKNYETPKIKKPML